MATGYHEPYAELPAETRDHHRALTSLIEELEAIDWYHQRIAVTQNDELKAIIIHNRNEEMEHASMLLEWLRRNMEPFDEKIKTYLLKTGSIIALEQQAEQGGTPARPALAESLGLGKTEKGNRSW